MATAVFWLMETARQIARFGERVCRSVGDSIWPWLRRCCLQPPLPASAIDASFARTRTPRNLVIMARHGQRPCTILRTAALRSHVGMSCCDRNDEPSSRAPAAAPPFAHTMGGGLQWRVAMQIQTWTR